MTELSTDLRILRTKRLIRNAMTELMQEKGFEGFTVSDLTDRAAINRSTFYSHYRDKYDLLERSEEEILCGIERIIEKIYTPSSQKRLNELQPDEPEPWLVEMFQYILDNQEFMKVSLGSKGNPLFQKKLKDLLRRKLIATFWKESIGKEMLVPVEYLTAYVISAHLGVIQHWLESGTKGTPYELSLILSRMTNLGPNHLTKALN